MEQLVAGVALSGIPYSADRLYSYRVDAGVEPGVRVSVPFGKGNRRCEGFVLTLSSVKAGEETAKLKRPFAVLDDAPLLEETGLKLVRWMKARYFCTYYDALRTLLPAGVWYRYRELYRLADAQTAEQALSAVRAGSVEEKLLRVICAAGESEVSVLREVGGEKTSRALSQLVSAGVLTRYTEQKQRVRDKTVCMVSLALAPEAAALAQKPTPKRKAVVQMLASVGAAETSELCYYTGVSMRTLRGMEKAGVVVFSELEKLRVPPPTAASAAPIVLNDEQQAAFDGLNALLHSAAPRPALLHGVTASGKTQVYIRLIEQALSMGKSALLLVPEIALTPQMLAKFTAHFGGDVAMLHSALPLSERYDQWKRIRRGEVRIVLGTRSAVFAPLQNLGLILLDEEQEGSYQSEQSPRYHAREVALYRAAQQHALLVLGSATPTVETAYYARSGRYEVFYLYSRYNAKALPQVRIADLRQELRNGNDSGLSAELKQELAKNLSRGEQSILFLNRRGSSRMLLCGECGQAPECPRCSVPLTYHSANRRLMCHYCGYSEQLREKCTCGGLLRPVGVGTQRVEQELHACFPEAEVLRMDADTVTPAHSHEQLLRRFVDERIPILLGTQMVAKGLDFENVTLVGVLAADQSLYVENYHAAERTFSLLTQVVGRAGRGEKQGRAVLQTYSPEHDIIRAAAAQDYEAFYAAELRYRRARHYPPFADLYTLTVVGAEEKRVLTAAQTLSDALRYAVSQREALHPLDIDVLGPAPAPIVRVNNRYRYRIFLVGKSDAALRRLTAEFLQAFSARRENRGLDIYADCNSPE